MVSLSESLPLSDLVGKSILFIKSYFLNYLTTKLFLCLWFAIKPESHNRFKMKFMPYADLNLLFCQHKKLRFLKEYLFLHRAIDQQAKQPGSLSVCTPGPPASLQLLL